MLDRRAVLSSIRKSFPSSAFTPSCLADMLGEPEYAVRACVSWLALAGVLTIDGTVTRLDHRGVPYRATCYRLSGRDLPTGRIKQNRADREQCRRMERDRSTRATAADWLSRSWAAPAGP